MAENTMENCREIIPFFVAEAKRVNDVVISPIEWRYVTLLISGDMSPGTLYLVLLGNWG